MGKWGKHQIPECQQWHNRICACVCVCARERGRATDAYVKFYLNVKIRKYLTFTFQDIDNGEVAAPHAIILKLCDTQKEWRHMEREKERKKETRSRSLAHEDIIV